MQIYESLESLPSDGQACCPEVEEILSVPFFRALCDPSRASILGRLAAEGEALRVSEIASYCPVDISVVSRHLAVLRRAGAVCAERKGREVFYRIDREGVAAVLRGLADAIESCCPASGEARKEKGNEKT